MAYSFGDAGAVATIACCDANDCLVFAREQATGDEHASITRLRNSAMLFHREPASKLPDHQPPFVCADCRVSRHSRCKNQVPVRRSGHVVVVECECHAMHHSPSLGGTH